MLNGDLASSPLASYRPDMAGEIDTLRDHLCEIVDAHARPLPGTLLEFSERVCAIVAAALRDANIAEAIRRGVGTLDDPELVDGLRQIAADRDHQRAALRAACLLKQLGLDSRSDQQLARDYGLTTRAAPQNIRRQIEKRTGLRCRSSKSDGTRERCRQRRLGAKRPVREDKWIGFAIYASS